MPRIRKTAQINRERDSLWKIAVYIRLSRDDGNDESMSVTNQRKIINEYIENSFDGEHIIIDYYVDDGQSGTTDYERASFQRMIRDIKMRTVNCIICKTLARAFRNYSDQGYFLEKVFPLYNVRFISLGDPAIDTYLHPEIIQGIEVPITGLMNDRYAARTSNDVRRTFNMKRRKGEFIGSFAPYGYIKDPKNKNHLIIDEEAAQIVRNIFKWFVYDGMSKSGILKYLNALGIPAPLAYNHSKGLNLQIPNAKKSDGMWQTSTIFRILKNKMYVGAMVQGRQRVISYKVHDKIAPSEKEWFIVENTHEPIIDKATFEKAQNLGKRDTRTAPSKDRVYLFSGFLRCPDCGMGMKRTTHRKKSKSGVKEYTYYVCSTYSIKNKNKCTRHSIRLEDLTEAVLKTIQAQIALVEDMEEIIAEINKQPVVHKHSRQLECLLKEREEELEKITYVADNLYMDWKCGDITRDEYMHMKAKFEQQSDKLKQIIQNIKTKVIGIQKNIGIDDPYLKTFLKYKNIKTLDRGLLVELIDTIYVYENNKITIKFNFADQHKQMLEFIENNKKQLMGMKNQAM